MRNVRTTITSGLALCIATLGGCGVEKLDDQGPSGGGGVPAAVQERLTTYCAVPGCHMGVQSPDLTAGSSGAALMMASTVGPPFVVFGDPEGSHLITRIIPGGGMPVAGFPQMTPEDVAIIYGWVAGAPFPDEATTGMGSSGGETETAATMPSTTMDTASTTPPDMGASESGTAPETMACDLETVAPGTANPIDAGDAAGQIPTVIGDVLLANCGCHYLEAGQTAASGYIPFPLPMATLAEWGTPAPSNAIMADSALSRVRDMEGMGQQMPMPVCDIDGMGTIMEPADRDLLISWLEDGTPDGASFP